MNLEPKARDFLAAYKSANLPPLDSGSPQQARDTAKAMRKTTPPRDLPFVRDLRIGPDGGLDARLYLARDQALGCLIYFHGGGWVLGSVIDSDPFARELAAITGWAVLSVNYRLAPEAPFPAALDDADVSLRWLLANRGELFGADVPIGVIGDSAGANIATVLANSEEGRRGIAFQILAYPVTDGRMKTKSYTQFADGTHLTAGAMAWFWGHYVADEAARLDPRASPLLAPSLAGAPPAFVLTAENDPLRDEGEAYAAALQRDGASVLARRYDGQLHGFLTLVGMFDGGAAALRDIAEYLEARA